MSKDYQHSFKRLAQIKNWDDLSQLFDEVISGAGITSEDTENAQREAGRLTAEYMNNKDKQGKQI